MVLKIVQAAADRFFPYQYAYHILIGIVTLATIRAFAQGRTTNRERDLHNRTFLVTGAFTPTGLTLIQSLAKRGAKIIALSPHPIDSPAITILISLFRTTFNNEHIYAEQCNLTNPSDIRKFCMRFLTEGEDGTDSKPDSQPDNNAKPKATTDKRLDGIIFAHEYQHIGNFSFLRNKSSATAEQEQTQRESNSLATFLIITLILPALLVAPVERDIRIINVVNPFYAAAAASVRTSKTFNPSFKLSTSTSTPTSTTRSSIFLTEGLRSLRTIILTRHLQRIFDALPKPQIPKAEEGSSTIPVVSSRMQRSNIVAVSISPGLSRVDTISRLLNADWKQVENDENGSFERKVSWFGVLLYTLLLPFLHITTKSPQATIQSILHALFLPTPFKVLSQSITTTTSEAEAPSSPSSSSSSKPRLTHEELLKPGALYAECAVVNLPLSIPTPPTSPTTDTENKQLGDQKTNPAPTSASNDKGKNKDSTNTLREEVLQIDDDGEYGGELAGRIVWEAYESALKIWERGVTA